MVVTFDKAKPGAILRRKTIGSQEDSQLPDENPQRSDRDEKIHTTISFDIFYFN